MITLIYLRHILWTHNETNFELRTTSFMSFQNLSANLLSNKFYVRLNWQDFEWHLNHVIEYCCALQNLSYSKDLLFPTLWCSFVISVQSKFVGFVFINVTKVIKSHLESSKCLIVDADIAIQQHQYLIISLT